MSCIVTFSVYLDVDVAWKIRFVQKIKKGKRKQENQHLFNSSLRNCIFNNFFYTSSLDTTGKTQSREKNAMPSAKSACCVT